MNYNDSAERGRKQIIALLIIIAAGIWGNFLFNVIDTGGASAASELDVNIRKVGGKTILYGDPLPVNVDEIAGMRPSLTFPIPVEIE